MLLEGNPYTRIWEVEMYFLFLLEIYNAFVMPYLTLKCPLLFQEEVNRDLLLYTY